MLNRASIPLKSKYKERWIVLWSKQLNMFEKLLTYFKKYLFVIVKNVFQLKLKL